MGFAEIQAAFAQNAQPTAQAAAQPTPAQAPAFAPTFQPAPAPAFPTPSFVQPGTAPAAAAPVQGSFAFTPPAGFNPSSAPPINPPGERAALTAPEPTPAPAVEDPDPAPAKAKRGRKPKAAEAEAAPPIQGVTLNELGASHAAGIESLVQALYALGVSSVHLTFSKEGS